MKKSELQPYEFRQFYGTYLSALGDVDLMQALQKGLDEFVTFIDSIPENLLLQAYDEGKWTLAEVLCHIIDTERIFQYRALRFSRNDSNALQGFEQDDYILYANANSRSKSSLLEEYSAVRKSSIALFMNFNDEQLQRIGTASHIQWSVAGLGFVISGHQEHHRKIIEERYL